MKMLNGIKGVLMGSVVLAILTGLGCAARRDVAEAKSDGNVNNGPGPLGATFVCKGKDKTGKLDVSIRLEHTAAVTLDAGYLNFGKEKKYLYCKNKANSLTQERNQRSDQARDQNTLFEDCEEVRKGGTSEGIFLVEIYEQGITCLTLGTVSIKSAFPAKPQILATISCNKNEEN
ncbi:MAG: hypothetical protein NTV34_11520 [Proteobacteria bacterium]|nr:hypothetical protein [Pseudomonadota bacterium]